MEEDKLKDEGENLIRILATDIPTSISVYSGLTRIKGISWSLSNAICNKLEINKEKKIGDLSEKELEIISDFIKNPDLPNFVLNRRRDLEDGEDKHLIGSDLELKQEFDIKRLKKIRSYRGLRHATGRPVRGQRTKGHFRSKTSLGVAKSRKMRKATGSSK